MDSKILKEAIASDLKSLKTIELYIMPANVYYRRCCALFGTVVLKISLAGVLAALMGFIFWKPHFKDGLEAFLFLFGGPIGIALLAALFSLPLTSNHIIFKHQLQEKLRTGEFIRGRLETLVRISYRIFLALLFIAGLLWGPYPIMAVEVASLVIGSLLIALLAEMEIKRVGLAVLFEALQKYFAKEQRLFDN